MLLSLVSLLILNPPARPVNPVVPLKYRVDIKSQVTIGAKGDANYLDDVTEAVAFVTLTMTDTTIGRFANFVVDSMTYNGGETAMGMAMESPALLKNPKGATVRFLVIGGAFSSSVVPPVVKPEQENIPLGAILPALPALFPGMRKDAKAGLSWADTARSNQPGVMDQITTWVVAPGEGDALLFTSTRSAARRSEAPDSTVMNGKETSSQELLTSSIGPALKIKVETLLDGLITGGEAGTKGVPIKTVRTLKIVTL